MYRLPEGIWARSEQHMRTDTSHVPFPILCQWDEDIDLCDSVLPEHPHRKLSGRFALAMRTTSSRFTIYLRSSAPTGNLALKWTDDYTDVRLVRLSSNRKRRYDSPNAPSSFSSIPAQPLQSTFPLSDQERIRIPLDCASSIKANARITSTIWCMGIGLSDVAKTKDCLSWRGHPCIELEDRLCGEAQERQRAECSQS